MIIYVYDYAKENTEPLEKNLTFNIHKLFIQI